MPCWTCAQAMVIGPLVWHRVPVGSSSAWKCESMDHSQKKRRRKKHKAAIACRECQITGWNTRWNKKHRWSMWYNTFAYFFYLFFNLSSKEFLNKSGLLVTSQSIGFLWYMCIHFFVYTYFCSIDYVVHLSGVMRKKKHTCKIKRNLLSLFPTLYFYFVALHDGQIKITLTYFDG